MWAYVERQALQEGKRLYLIPEGASDAIGALGYLKAVEEIEEQLRQTLLAQVAKVEGCSRAEIVRRAIRDRLQGHNLDMPPTCPDEAG